MYKPVLTCVMLTMFAMFACSFTTDFETPDGSVSDSNGTGLDTNSDDGSDCTGCFIAGFCVLEGLLNPENMCEVCDPSIATDAWSNGDEQLCDDGLFCTEDDACLDGACVGSPKSCDDGIACTGTESCDDVIDACVDGTSTCSSGSVCDVLQNRCVPTCSGCLIEGLCYVDNQKRAGNECLVCDVDISETDWTLVADTTPCDDPNDYCNINKACNLGQCEGGAPRPCNDGIACNGTETCNGSSEQCVPGTSACALDELCDTVADQCVLTCTGCVISGSCYGVDQDNPLEECEFCQTAADTAWTPKADATLCNDGAGSCSSGVCS